MKLMKYNKKIMIHALKVQESQGETAHAKHMCLRRSELETEITGAVAMKKREILQIREDD